MKYREVLKPFTLNGVQYKEGQYILESLIINSTNSEQDINPEYPDSVNESLDSKVSSVSFDLILG